MRRLLLVSTLAFLSTPVVVDGHHAVGPNFDQSRIIEVEGEITQVLWQNPHIYLLMNVVGPDGSDQTWRIEAPSISSVSRRGLTEDLVEVGAKARVAGNPGRIRQNSMWVQNVQLSGRDELLFHPSAVPRWSSEAFGGATRTAVATDIDGEYGLFRVWTSATSPPQFWGDAAEYQLTASAQAARESYNPVTDVPTLNCAPKGMPYIMEQPYPMQMIDEGDVIVMRLEEYDSVRRIFMTPEAAQQRGAPGIFGLSIGRWDGDTLVVETTDITYPHFGRGGIPQSTDARIEERLSLNEDGSRLDYLMNYFDPNSFTEPLTLTRAWEWRPGEQVQPFNCVDAD